MRHLIQLSMRQRVLVNLLFLLVMGVGAAVYVHLPVDSWPEVSLDQAWITTYWDGAGAEDVERLVTREIEEEIEDVFGISRITSNSQPGLSHIDVKFDEDLHEEALERAFNDLRAALDRVLDLPEGAEQPLLRRLTTSELYPLFSVVVYSREPDVPELVLRETARGLRSRLSEVEGVERVRYSGYRDRELHVVLDRLEARRYGIGILEVVDALRRTNRAHPAGSIEDSPEGREAASDRPAAEEVRLKFDDEIASADALEEAVVRAYPGAAPLRVRDIARVEPGFEKIHHIIRINGHKAIVLDVAKGLEGDTRRLRADCGREIDEYRKSSLPGIEFEVVADQSEVLESRFNVLLENLLLGIVFVSLILFFAIGLRNALIALVGLPFSYIASFLFFPALDITINNLTLFGMVLVGGMLVDDAIIVIENIYRHLEKGSPLRKAVLDGASEVAWPVLNACLTTVAALLPLLIQGGVTGKFFSFIPKVVLLALLFSVVQCVSVLPVHYLEFGARVRGGAAGFLERVRTAFFTRASAAYARALGVVLRYRLGFLTVLGGVSLLLVGLVLQIPQDPWISDFNAIFVTLKCDPSYSLEQTDAASRVFQDELDELLEEGILENYYSVAGFSMTTDGVFMTRPDVAFFMAGLVDRADIASNPERIIRRLRSALRGRVAREERFRFTSWEVFAPHDGPPLGKPVAVRVESNDYREAQRVAEEIKAELSRMPGVDGIADNLDLGPRELRFVPDIERASALGVFPRQMALALRAANDGLEAGSYKDRSLDEDLAIRVLYAEKHRDAPGELSRVDLAAGTSMLVPIGDLSRVEVWRPNSSYYHYDTRRTVLVTADVDGVVATGPQVNEHLQAVFHDASSRHPGVRLVFGGEFEETQKSMAQQRQSFWIALVLIYVLLAGQFRSYLQPLIVMAVVPFGVLGVLLGLWVRSQPFTIPTFIAMIGLAGVVVNDSLMLVEFINLRRREGLERWAAILTAARQRFRPVLLTAGSTISNLIPLAWGLGGTSRVWTPFAVSIVFGMAVASLMTLFMVPVLYSLVVRK